MNAKDSGIIFHAGCLPESDPICMSYILDALKKIELEKNKKRSDGRISIANDLFQERKQPNAGSGIGKIAALVLAASLLAGGGTWFVLNGNNHKSATAVRPSAPPQAVQVTAPPVATPVQAVAPVMAPPTVPPAAAAAPQTNTAASGDDNAAVRGKARRSVIAITAEPVVQKKQPVQTVPAPADVKLSGIAWQDERSGRRAVINGFLLKEGAVVSGAKIIDIQADRVRFASAGGEFEIRLDAVLPSEVKR
jgi:general secretion pathway protein B